MKTDFFAQMRAELDAIKQQGLYKHERLITGPQAASIRVASSKNGQKNGQKKGQNSGQNYDQEVLNFCANNYLGLANHDALKQAAFEAQEQYGFGMASVRFICGTQDIHKKLERTIADWLGYEDSILYAACFDANGGVFEPLLGPQDAIISDSLNHASIIDGVRLCKAKRYRYANSDMADLEAQLKQARRDDCRNILIVTDGVFSMDGYVANLPDICDLADTYQALTMVDDCHATGFMGKNGRGSAEFHHVMGRIDILTGTLGKALGGAMGGFTCGRQEIIDMLRQKSRPYLFSNSLAPSLVGASIKAIELAKNGAALRAQLFNNAKQFRTGMAAAGFTLQSGEHPIIPVMLGDASLAQTMADKLLDEGIYVTGFFFPVVPKGQARIRTQMSADHTPAHIERAITAFTKVGREIGVIS